MTAYKSILLPKYQCMSATIYHRQFFSSVVSKRKVFASCYRDKNKRYRVNIYTKKLYFRNIQDI